MRQKSVKKIYWIPLIVIVLSLVAVVCAIIATFFPQKPPEPLADAASLGRLVAGIPAIAPLNNQKRAEFHGTPVALPNLAGLGEARQILGLSSQDASKRIEVNLTNQMVYAIEGDRIVYQFLVSTGKWGRTPTGEFTIWTKVRSQLMSGGSKALHTYYYLPNVPYVMFFYNNDVAKMRGFSFHGTYWHSNFGHPMSHGCINMRIEDAKTLYEWATPVVTNAKAWSTPATPENPGTRVVIYGTTPKE